MLPLYSLKGSPREIGRQYGASCAEGIHKNIDLYFRVFKHYANLDRSRASRLARSFIPVIGAFDQDLLEEMKGIAEGAGADFDEILSINVRTELMYPDQLAGKGECTALAALPEATASGDMLLGQNWDWKPQLLETTILLRLEQEKKPTVLTMTEAGIVGKIGFNSAGLGACLNILKSPLAEVGIPIHILMRGILNSERFGDAIGKIVSANRGSTNNTLIADAIGKIVSANRGSANNTLIAHRDGVVIDFEMAPKELDFLYPGNGILVHTNNFVSPRLRPLDQNLSQFPDTLLRYGRAQQMIQQRAGRITVADFKEVLSDHCNHPDSICRHPDPRDPELERVQT
ncbi:MAG: acyl-CoA--6-aminopenicillanic acid acyl-transferase, partial [Deltaproteobacteria bacterium]|nr:acyl-CoA--6-aminopenicillanic acid acyl-transferase [Deltaproteobacteria bacterium]